MFHTTEEKIITILGNNYENIGGDSIVFCVHGIRRILNIISNKSVKPCTHERTKHGEHEYKLPKRTRTPREHGATCVRA